MSNEINTLMCIIQHCLSNELRYIYTASVTTIYQNYGDASHVSCSILSALFWYCLYEHMSNEFLSVIRVAINVSKFTFFQH